jgi:hypothetical protein
MKDFWAWATVHYWMAFILAWSVVVTVGKVLSSFFGMFHRNPRIKFTDDQFVAFQAQLKERPETLAQLVDRHQNADVNPSRAPTWYERIMR